MTTIGWAIVVLMSFYGGYAIGAALGQQRAEQERRVLRFQLDQTRRHVSMLHRHVRGVGRA